MPIYEFGQNEIIPIKETNFGELGLRERRDLQRLLREHIEVLGSDILVISEEFGEWDESRRRIDLLAIDKHANLVVVELKRTEDGGHMELQAIRYAAMVSTMTFDQASEVFGRYLEQIGRESQDPRATMLNFLGWDQPDQGEFGQDVHIILASAEFSKELTSSVLWLLDHGVDVRCVRLKPYSLAGHTLVDVQQIIPLPEVEEYQIQIREKARRERVARNGGVDFTRYDLELKGQTYPAMRKRNALFAICKRLCETGVTPEEIGSLFPARPTSIWYTLDGVLDAELFKSQAREISASGGRQFVEGRWFCAEGDLIHSNGKTYAFSTQWGGDTWLNAMESLKDQYPQLGIAFNAALN